MINWLFSFTSWLVLKLTNRWLDLFENHTLLGFILMPLYAVVTIAVLALELTLGFVLILMKIIVGVDTFKRFEIERKLDIEYDKIISRNKKYEEDEGDEWFNDYVD